MRKALLLVAGIALPAFAAMAQPPVPKGYTAEPLGASAIEQRDWSAAERELNARGLKQDDPARLINLGRIYMETGRRDEAIALWRQAMASDQEYMVQTAKGETISTRELARRALALYGRDTRTAAALR